MSANIKTNQNTHSINCTHVTITTVTVTAAVTAITVLELLHGPFLSPQTSQFQFSPISRGGIKWLVCRSNSLGTSHSTQGQDEFSSSFTTLLHYTILHSAIYRCAKCHNKYFY